MRRDDDGGGGEEGDSGKRGKNGGGIRAKKVIALTGTAAIVAVAINFAFGAFNSRLRRRKSKDLVGSNVRVNLSAGEIRKLADRVIAESKEVHDAIASVPVDKVRYQDIMALAELDACQFPMVQSCVFPKFVSTSEDVRKASAEAEQRINSHIATCRKREDVYRILKAFATRGEWINDEASLYVHSLIRDFERNGLNLSSTKKEEAQRLQTQIDDLSMQYIQNLNDDLSFLLFTETELEGLPHELLKILDRSSNDKVKITLKSIHVLPVLELCEVRATRRKVAVAYGKRCRDLNMPLFENLVLLRHKYARLLGYDNYAEYAVCSRMAMTSSKVFEFLEDLSTSVSELAAKELETLKDLKIKEDANSPFGIEDLLYYVKKYEEEKFSVDFVALKEYFPVSLVLQGIFKIVQDLFCLRFDEIMGAEVWHDDVRVFSVFDLSSGELMGYVYLDLYSREEKFSQTCVLPLQNGSLSSNGARQVPIVLLMTEHQKKDIYSPAVLRFSEVVSLFHEFGHVVHHICNHSSLARFSGLRVDHDFLEIPGHMFENWCYESRILKLISGYYQDITRPINDEICTSLRRWRHSFSALKLTQEILYCLFDQIIYSDDNVDLLEVFKFLHPKVMLGLPILEGTNPASCFPHSAVGYEASCYSRIWSKVFAADLYTSKFHGGFLNNHNGMHFRNKVLAPGGAKDPLGCLTNFLEREPSIQAFVDNIASSSV